MHTGGIRHHCGTNASDGLMAHLPKRVRVGPAFCSLHTPAASACCNALTCELHSRPPPCARPCGTGATAIKFSRPDKRTMCATYH
jgi:hypothetical protein